MTESIWPWVPCVESSAKWEKKTVEPYLTWPDPEGPLVIPSMRGPTGTAHYVSANITINVLLKPFCRINTSPFRSGEAKRWLNTRRLLGNAPSGASAWCHVTGTLVTVTTGVSALSWLMCTLSPGRASAEYPWLTFPAATATGLRPLPDWLNLWNPLATGQWKAWISDVAQGHLQWICSCE